MFSSNEAAETGTRDSSRNSLSFPKPESEFRKRRAVSGFSIFEYQASVGRSNAVIGLFVGEIAEDFSFESSFIFFGLHERLVVVTFHGHCPRRFDTCSIIVDTREKDVTGPELLFGYRSAATEGHGLTPGYRGKKPLPMPLIQVI